MEKLGNSNSREIQCVGKLEIASPKSVGFLCGSIHVPTDKPFNSFSSALVPSSQTVSAPRYRMLPTETDLNSPPLPTASIPDMGSSAPTEGVPWDDGVVTSNLTRKGEALAVSGLVEYGDEIDVIAPADILKQIFKIPYTKARLSIAVHRVGQTLILNAGPDVEDGERFVRRNQPKCSDESLFLNFAMHSVRMEACDCPPTHSSTAEGQPKSSVLPDLSRSKNTSFKSSEFQAHNISEKEQSDEHSDYSKGKDDGLYWENTKSKRSKARDPVKKASHIGEKPRCPVQESDKYRRCGDDEFLRVLFWQFHNFRVLLGSDLLLFSNEKYVSVSLHLWDVSRQVTPITWLEAWLDNVMASVPELAICYHRNGVVKGYELLKTDDIFRVKGVSEDGTPAFHPYIVQQNGLSVLRFLQANCKQDPGAYWLYKNTGEDVIQLFDLSVIPQSHQPESNDGCSSTLPSLIFRGRSDSLLTLGTLLYRIAHRLSLSMAPNNRFRCAQFVRKCLELLDEPDHLVVRAFAHEQFARLILNSDVELDLAAEVFPLASEVIVTDHEEESLDIVSIISESSNQESSNSDPNNSQDSFSEASGGDFQDNININVSESTGCTASDLVDAKSSEFLQPLRADESYASTPADVIRTIADPISSKLAAVHHVSQAIKSLRWTRQLHGAESEFVDDGAMQHPTLPDRFSICACGDTDCIEVCDIREWLPTLKLDQKLWKLILLLGESYLALGQAYMEDGQLLQALKVVEAACSVYGSVPQYLQDSKFVSSMGNGLSWHNRPNNREEQGPLISDKTRPCKSSYDYRMNPEDFSSTYLFWAKAWMLVGDVYVEFLTVHSKEISPPPNQTHSAQELRMSSEVVKELMRLKKKLGHDVENCSTCSLVNCSCQSDRASSGISASSSNGDTTPLGHGRKSKRSHLRSVATSSSANPEKNRFQCKGGSVRNVVAMRDKNDGGTTTEKHNMTTDGNREQSVHSISCVDHGEKTSAPATMEGARGASGSYFDSSMDTTTGESPKSRSGGIFKYLQGPGSTDTDGILSLALICYESATKAFGELSTGSHELQSVLKKIGWVCNELGRIRLERKNLAKAEAAFAKAIDAFREVSDYTNIILINCNLGHGRRALAEELVSKMEYFKSKSILRDAYVQALDAAKVEYGKSLRFYGAAKSELSNVNRDVDNVPTDLSNEVYTQYAHTYLRLGMLLAREGTIANVYINGALEDKPMGSQGLSDKRTKKGHKKSQITASDAIGEALSIYDSLGGLRKQETAYAYFQLACHQRDSCLKFSKLSHKSSNQSKSENGILQRVKQYLSLAERNWQKAVEFYSAKTHPVMYLTILIEKAALLSTLANVYNSHTMLETALSCLLEGRHVSEQLHSDSSTNGAFDVCAKFWTQLQMLLKKMLASSLSAVSNKTAVTSQATSLSKRSGDTEKLKELYKISLKSPDFHLLHSMNSLWTGIAVQNHQAKATACEKLTEGSDSTA